MSAEDLFGTGWATDTQEPQPEAEGYPEPDQGKEGEEEEEEEPASEPGPDWVVAKVGGTAGVFVLDGGVRMEGRG